MHFDSWLCWYSACLVGKCFIKILYYDRSHGFKTLAIHIHFNGLGGKKRDLSPVFFDRLVIKEDFS